LLKIKKIVITIITKKNSYPLNECPGIENKKKKALINGGPRGWTVLRLLLRAFFSSIEGKKRKSLAAVGAWPEEAERSNQTKIWTI